MNITSLEPHWPNTLRAMKKGERVEINPDKVTYFRTVAARLKKKEGYKFVVSGKEGDSYVRCTKTPSER